MPVRFGGGAHARGGDEGRDDLGYDFRVPQKRGGFLMFEVKASSQADDYSFELSEKEIIVARENRANKRYRIVFVSNVLSPERRLFVLPNPQSDEGAGRFRTEQRGIRYSFRPRATA